MKRNLLIILIFFSLNTIAQKAAFNENFVTYLGRTYKVGDIIHLGYGSENNKSFAFVNYGKSVGGVKLPGMYHHADVDWSKADVEIVELYTKNGVIWARCNPKDRGSSVGSVLGNKIYINIEGAVDNKEIMGVDVHQDFKAQQSVNASPPPESQTKEVAAVTTPDTKSDNNKAAAKIKTLKSSKQKTNAN